MALRSRNFFWNGRACVLLIFTDAASNPVQPQFTASPQPLSVFICYWHFVFCCVLFFECFLKYFFPKSNNGWALRFASYVQASFFSNWGGGFCISGTKLWSQFAQQGLWDFSNCLDFTLHEMVQKRRRKTSTKNHNRNPEAHFLYPFLFADSSALVPTPQVTPAPAASPYPIGEFFFNLAWYPTVLWSVLFSVCFSVFHALLVFPHVATIHFYFILIFFHPAAKMS